MCVCVYVCIQASRTRLMQARAPLMLKTKREHVSQKQHVWSTRCLRVYFVSLYEVCVERDQSVAALCPLLLFPPVGVPLLWLRQVVVCGWKHSSIMVSCGALCIEGGKPSEHACRYPMTVKRLHRYECTVYMTLLKVIRKARRQQHNM